MTIKSSSTNLKKASAYRVWSARLLVQGQNRREASKTSRMRFENTLPLSTIWLRIKTCAKCRCGLAVPKDTGVNHQDCRSSLGDSRISHLASRQACRYV